MAEIYQIEHTDFMFDGWTVKNLMNPIQSTHGDMGWGSGSLGELPQGHGKVI